MGSPLSPIVAHVVLQDLEKKALNSINLELPFYYRYVDDIVMAAPRDSIDFILRTFNSFHERLQFTLELEHDRNLNFLDILLIIVDNKIIIDWFHKKTFSGRYLSFFSHHPLQHKIGIIFNLVDRAILLSHPTFHQKNLEIIVKLLLENGYPLEFIFKHIKIRINKLINNKLSSSKDTSNQKKEDIPKKFFILPYIKNLSERTASLINKNELTVGFRCIEKMSNIIKVHKDKTDHFCNNNVVYKFGCNECDATYVGQTKRQLRTRVKEHMNNIKLDPSRHSVVTEHRIKYDHTFNWEKIEILDSEPNYKKRLISEMIHIKQQNNGINSHKDTEFLHDTYFHLLDLVKNK